MHTNMEVHVTNNELEKNRLRSQIEVREGVKLNVVDVLMWSVDLRRCEEDVSEWWARVFLRWAVVRRGVLSAVTIKYYVMQNSTHPQFAVITIIDILWIFMIFRQFIIFYLCLLINQFNTFLYLIYFDTKMSRKIYVLVATNFTIKVVQVATFTEKL